MMGRSSQDQVRLFYSFNLEEVVPADHLVRQIGVVLDLSWAIGCRNCSACRQVGMDRRRIGRRRLPGSNGQLFGSVGKMPHRLSRK
jgi:hypothetical protein